MKEHGHWTPGLCPGATEHGAMVSSSVPSMPPLLRLQRALPWAALCEVLPRRWAAAGQHTEGRPGVPGAVSLYVPGVVLLCVQHLHAREMAASLAEHGVARGCLGRQGEARPQMRDHSNRARAYAALGQAGGDASKALRLPVAQDVGGAAVRLLSSATTAQALPLGYPNAPGS
jgi:hypothetical protein